VFSRNTTQLAGAGRLGGLWWAVVGDVSGQRRLARLCGATGCAATSKDATASSSQEMGSKTHGGLLGMPFSLPSVLPTGKQAIAAWRIAVVLYVRTLQILSGQLTEKTS